MADVFISYSRKDIQFAQRIHHELEARDREPWVDWQDILLKYVVASSFNSVQR